MDKRQSARQRPAKCTSAAYGLLVSAATAPNRRAAAAVRQLLADWEIRSTAVPADGDRCDVLVFPEDADRAFLVLTTMLTGPEPPLP